MTKTRYEWSQEQRKIESAIRERKDVANLAKASGDDVLRRNTQYQINQLDALYGKISDGAGLIEQRERMSVAGFRKVKTTGELKNLPKPAMIITDKQMGSKSGKHMAEWGLNPANPEDRQQFIALTKDIREHADEVRMVAWEQDPATGKRTVEVLAYIKGDDVVLTSTAGRFITTMKGAAKNNQRIKSGRTV